MVIWYFVPIPPPVPWVIFEWIWAILIFGELLFPPIVFFMSPPVVYCYPMLTATFDIGPGVRFIRSSVRPGPEIIEVLAACMMAQKNFRSVGSIYEFISIIIIRNMPRSYVPCRPPSRPNWTMRLVTAFGCYPHIWALSRQ